MQLKRFRGGCGIVATVMRRLLVLLFWRGRTPGPWADRVYLIIVGAAILFVYVRLALLLLGVWPLNLPFGLSAPSL